MVPWGDQVEAGRETFCSSGQAYQAETAEHLPHRRLLSRKGPRFQRRIQSAHGEAQEVELLIYSCSPPWRLRNFISCEVQFSRGLNLRLISFFPPEFKTEIIMEMSSEIDSNPFLSLVITLMAGT